MTAPNKNEFNTDSTSLLKFILRYYKPLLIVSLVAAVVSAIGSYLITPVYTSRASFYPVNIREYSEESEAEQALQVIQSLTIKEKLIDAFNLYAHYGIHKEDPLHNYYMLNELGGNVSFSKTSYDALQVTVTDENPQIASDMVDSVIQFYNDKVREMHRIKHKEMLEITGRELKKVEKEMDSLKNNLVQLGNPQEMVNLEMKTPEMGGTLQAIRRLKSAENLPPDYQIQNARLLELLEYHARIKRLYDENLMEHDKKITYAVMITHSYPADKRSFPVRSLIVILSTLSAFILAVIVLLLIEKLKREQII